MQPRVARQLCFHLAYAVTLTLVLSLGACAEPAVQLTRVAQGLVQPVGMAALDTRRLLILERGGQVRLLEQGKLRPQPWLDISALVKAAGQEQGLLGIALHPNFAVNGYVYLNYIRAQPGGKDRTVIARYTAFPDRSALDPASAQIMLEVEQDFANHNGGHLAFGPDGYLYIGLGDGGSGGDPYGRAQNPRTLLGKMLRIDVDAPPQPAAGLCGLAAHYAIPAGNPGGRLCPEIWALGLRNPWRYSFDMQGRLWIADVGQDRWEEINLQPPGTAGLNYGWRCVEGDETFLDEPDADCPKSPTMPVLNYRHEQGRCSVTGGGVYRGTAVPGLRDAYVYGDFCTGEIWQAAAVGAQWRSRLLIDTDLLLSSFGADPAGELYLLSLRGEVYRLDAR